VPAVALQGVNVWRALQYAVLVWFLMAMRNASDIVILSTVPQHEPSEVYDQAAAAPEVLDGVAVLDDARARPVDALRPPGALSPAVVQTVAVVSASMIAGAATVAIVQRRRTRRLARRRRRMFAPVLASRSFLVDVHVLGERGK
jgi:hypothetical protein